MRAPVALRDAHCRHGPLRHYYTLCRGHELSLHSAHGVKTHTKLTNNSGTHTHYRGNRAMASVSVVGQHRLDSEPQLFFFKLTGVGKKLSPLRKSSREKMMFRRGSGSDVECASVTTERGSVTQTLSLGPAEETTASGRMVPGEGCGAPVASAAPRSLDRYREAGSTHCDWNTGAGIKESQTGQMTSDCNSNNNCDSHRKTRGRRGSSFKRSGTNVQSESVANGHRGAHWHRDAPHGRRDSRHGDSGYQIISSAVSAQGESGSLPLQRLTQGRTGVVRLARTEPTRREAWSIFPQEVDPRVRTEKGEGHRFETKPVTQDWCDVCSSQMNVQALRCQSKYFQSSNVFQFRHQYFCTYLSK